MACIAWIGNLVFLGQRGRDESKCVRVHLNIRNGGLDLRHVAGHALASCAARLVMRMLFERGDARPVQPSRHVAIEANHIRWFSQF